MKWGDLSIGQKNGMGFGAVLGLLILLSIIVFIGVGGIVNNASQVIQGNKLDGELAQREVDHLIWVSKVNALLTDDTVTRLNVQTDDHKCGLGTFLFGEERKKAEALVPSLAPLFKSIERPHGELHESAIHISQVFFQADHALPTLFADRIIDHLKWALTVREAMNDRKNSLGVQVDPEKCALGKWMISDYAKNAYDHGDSEYKRTWDQMVSVHNELHKSAASINALLTSSSGQDEFFQKAEDIYTSRTKPALDSALTLLTDLKTEAESRLSGMDKAARIYSEKTLPALNEVQLLLSQLRQETREHIMTDDVMLDSARKTRSRVVVLSILAVILGIVLAFVISSSICRVLSSITDRIGSASEQVAGASEQVAQTSQSLAEGTAEQASAIEETSASIEQLSAMIRQNAENSGKADIMMKEANAVMEKADRSMSGLTGAMASMMTASQETSKIIKTIDEIAFQTNLLALNAAVEAARAGEAGAGFAVVAGEVRNLALRAAQAAKNTTELIEGTVRKIDEGSKIVSDTGEAFSEVAKSAATVGEVLHNISSASSEQAEGIEHLNTAIEQMDKVTQSNAANAEESASAAEEMNAQSRMMEETTRDLLNLVHGAKKSMADSQDVKTQGVYLSSEKDAYPAI